MTKLQKLIDNKTPFAVMEYYYWCNSLKTETRKDYELIFITSENKLGYKKLDDIDKHFFKRSKEQMELVVDNKHGKVYEFLNFKEFKKAKKVQNNFD
jgi:hypothetical protein